MSRRTIILIASAVAALLAGLGLRACDYKIVPLIRIALWFPLPYLLHAESTLVLLALIQFPLLVCIFALAIRRWRVVWVLMAFIMVYALYACVVIAKLGPPR
ncbi:MAG: hypothetical protein P4N60_13400 [Verrucomicrobiae bacterium]|nr:hypothetical protein [Verrucomicrobiae bacterium]